VAREKGWVCKPEHAHEQTKRQDDTHKHEIEASDKELGFEGEGERRDRSA
jgi:hypothetical protein